MKRVLILHTGGTLGMSGRRPTPLQPDTYAQEIVARVPELAALATVETRILCNLDSSDVGPDEWSALAEEVAQARAAHDGIVVIHGTDTMAYTASALSFALGGARSAGDAHRIAAAAGRDSLGRAPQPRRRRRLWRRATSPRSGSASTRSCCAVTARPRAMPGRTTAFASPNCPPLARLGLDVEVGSHVRRPTEPFSVTAQFDARVAVLLRDAGDDAADARAARQR